jgi:glyoxylase-like metal-dependent hydrolase (beta-lactamase superfamily II)
LRTFSNNSKGIKMSKKPIIHTLDVKFLGQDDTIAAYLLEVDGEIALVETGPHSTFDNLTAAIKRLGFDIKNIKKVFLTHIHFDHAGAAWAFAALGATIYVHPFGEKHIVEPSKLYNSAKMIYGDKMDYLWGKMEQIAPERIHAVTHGERIALGNTEIRTWYTPGHAVHHVVWQLGDDLFAGDVAGCKINGGIVVPPCPPPDIDVEAWIASLDLIKKLKVKRLYLTHFGTVTTVQKHLNQLEKRLIRWSNWFKPRYEKGLTAAEVTPQYQAFVQKELMRYGIVGTQLAQYESANPAWMSVAGLMRYWHKKELKIKN